jgi:hypothetical protein
MFVACSRGTESALLSEVITALPNLAHLSLHAGANDDRTLAPLFASLIPPGAPPHPAQGTFADRLRSLAYLVRAPWPAQPSFETTSPVPWLHRVLVNAPNLDLLVLDAKNDNAKKPPEVFGTSLREIKRPVNLTLRSNLPVISLMKNLLKRRIELPKQQVLISGQRDDHWEVSATMPLVPGLAPLAERGGFTRAQFWGPAVAEPWQKTFVTEYARADPSFQTIGFGGDGPGGVQWWGVWRDDPRESRVAVHPLRDGDLLALEMGLPRRVVRGAPRVIPSEGWLRTTVYKLRRSVALLLNL